MDEKDSVGVFLDDVAYTFADISALSIPVLFHLVTTATNARFGLKFAALVAWMTMVGGAALVRGGWITPIATDEPGWVAMTPWLVVLRIGYYNGVLALAAYGGRTLSEAVSPVASVGFALLVGALAVGVLPRIADWFYGLVAE